MRVVLPDQALPAKLTLNPEVPMNDDQYYAFCMTNSGVLFERTSEGEIIIVPPAGGESDYQSLEIAGQLREWAKRDARGKAFGGSVEFILPKGAALTPNAAWVSNNRLSELTKEQRRKFPPVCPEFIIEVMSPSDRLARAKEKMKEWIRGGIDLGWLIHADEQAAYIYRPGQPGPEKQSNTVTLAGEGPVAGFRLDLVDVWAGL